MGVEIKYFVNMFQKPVNNYTIYVQLDHHFAINSQRDCQPKLPKEYLGDFVRNSCLFSVRRRRKQL